MSDPNIHRFTSPIEGIPLPSAFTYPFHYTPHPLVQMAAHEVQVYLRTRSDWEEELSKGKMFGVLLIQDKEGNVGYLTAFSGNLAQNNRQRSIGKRGNLPASATCLSNQHADQPRGIGESQG